LRLKKIIEEAPMLSINTPAPDFTLNDKDGKPVSLSDFRGKRVVLYFYPKDNTPGCTQQACAYAERFPSFAEKNAVVIGISKDSEASHRQFAQKYNLPFILLSDPELKVIKLYDVWQEKILYGKISLGVERTSYVIDENGIIVKADRKVNAAANAGDMLIYLNSEQFRK
jgi:thioredoxin-dependent peroxiredoxin